MIKDDEKEEELCRIVKVKFCNEEDKVIKKKKKYSEKNKL